jgi:hypothetical protein
MHRNICHFAMYTVLSISTEKKFFGDAAAYTESGRIYLSEFRKVLSTFVTRRRLSLHLFAAVLSLSLCKQAQPERYERGSDKLMPNYTGTVGFREDGPYFVLRGKVFGAARKKLVPSGSHRSGPTPKSASRSNAKPTQVKPNLDGPFPSERNWHQTRSGRIRRESFCG